MLLLAVKSFGIAILEAMKVVWLTGNSFDMELMADGILQVSFLHQQTRIESFYCYETVEKSQDNGYRSICSIKVGNQPGS